MSRWKTRVFAWSVWWSVIVYESVQFVALVSFSFPYNIHLKGSGDWGQPGLISVCWCKVGDSCTAGRGNTCYSQCLLKAIGHKTLQGDQKEAEMKSVKCSRGSSKRLGVTCHCPLTLCSCGSPTISTLTQAYSGKPNKKFEFLFVKCAGFKVWECQIRWKLHTSVVAHIWSCHGNPVCGQNGAWDTSSNKLESVPDWYQICVCECDLRALYM